MSNQHNITIIHSNSQHHNKAKCQNATKKALHVQNPNMRLNIILTNLSKHQTIPVQNIICERLSMLSDHIVLLFTSSINLPTKLVSHILAWHFFTICFLGFRDLSVKRMEQVTEVKDHCTNYVITIIMDWSV